MLKELYNEHLYIAHLCQMLADYSPGARSNFWVSFVNNVLLEHIRVTVYLFLWVWQRSCGGLQKTPSHSHGSELRCTVTHQWPGLWNSDNETVGTVCRMLECEEKAHSDLDSLVV